MPSDGSRIWPCHFRIKSVLPAMANAVADRWGGHQGCALLSNPYSFMFHTVLWQKICKNDRLAPPPLGRKRSGFILVLSRRRWTVISVVVHWVCIFLPPPPPPTPLNGSATNCPELLLGNYLAMKEVRPPPPTQPSSDEGRTWRAVVHGETIM